MFLISAGSLKLKLTSGRQTNLSYGILQRCVMQLLLRQWHSPIKNSSDQKKLTITDKGLVVLDKMVELQKIMDPEKTHKMKVPQSKISVITVLSK